MIGDSVFACVDFTTMKIVDLRREEIEDVPAKEPDPETVVEDDFYYTADGPGALPLEGDGLEEPRGQYEELSDCDMNDVVRYVSD